AVQVKASHMCMELRGVNHTGLMTTSTLRGVFREDTTLREEFMQLANNGK
ncbi:MAG TPA: GTP cyclohydrolase I FolE, partial [Deltaproteobacteria bacterium]|nr:GTP cyclohydrolase I FolE [Deltaproteobacteria bacterium]